MKKVKLILGLAVIFSLLFTSCDDNDTIEDIDEIEIPEEETLDLITGTFENLSAPQEADYSTGAPVVSGEFTRFSFEEAAIVTSNDWDIAFRGTTILINGGEAYGYTDEPARTGDAALVLESGIFNDITVAPADDNFSQDAVGVLALTTGSGNGWYTYDSTTHLISPIAGKVIVIKTIDGNYAKIEILSYYQDYNTSSDSRYYSFNYVYNPNVGDTSLE